MPGVCVITFPFVSLKEYGNVTTAIGPTALELPVLIIKSARTRTRTLTRTAS